MKNYEIQGNLFGQNGKYRNLSKEEQKNLLLKVMIELENETQNNIKRSNSGISWDDSNLKPRLKHLIEAARNGIFIESWKEQLEKIEKATHYYYSDFSGKVIRYEREDIQAVAIEIEKLLHILPAGLNGQGLEFKKSEIGGGQRIYLDGEYVGTVSQARFSDSPTNNQVVAWLICEQIDYDANDGPQISHKIYAWEKGREEPQCVFCENGYVNEISLSVSAPEVLKDGTIKFIVNTNGKERIVGRRLI